MAMEFRHLRCFVVLAEELHFGRAARRLAMTQPPLSLNIQQLEATLGVRLFDRNSKSVQLTAAGAAFHRSALAMLAQAEEAGRIVREIADGAVGQLRIGFVGSMLFRGMPQWLQAFQQQHPRVVIRLIEQNSQTQIDALRRGELDVGLIHTGQVPDDLQVTRIRTEPFVACLPAGHRLARRRRLPVAALQGEPFILFSREVSPHYHTRILALCDAHGFQPNLRHEVRHWLSVVSLVAQGLGVAVVPRSVERSGLAGAVFRPLLDATQVTEVFAVWPAAQPSSLGTAFLALAETQEETPGRPRFPHPPWGGLTRSGRSGGAHD